MNDPKPDEIKAARDLQIANDAASFARILQRRLDSEYKERITDGCMSGCHKIDHMEADEVMCQLLATLGYHETVTAWRKVGKWYA